MTYPKTITRKGLFGGTTTITKEKTPGLKTVTKVRKRTIGPKVKPRIKTVTVVRTKRKTPKTTIVKTIPIKKGGFRIKTEKKRTGKRIERERKRSVTRTAIPVFPRF